MTTQNFSARHLSDVSSEQVAGVIDRHLVHLIPVDQIEYAKRGDNSHSSDGMFNPRTITGLDDNSIRELADSIAKDGLFKYPNVRPLGDKYQIVAGERRVRAIRLLIQEDALVHDEYSGEKVRASELYSQIPCRVLKTSDDRKALRIAFSENSTHRQISELELIELCEYLVGLEVPGEVAGQTRLITRKEVADELGKSLSWLSQTLSLKSKLDPETLEKLGTGEINRTFALRMMEYPQEHRVAVRKAAEEIAIERFHDCEEQAVAEKLNAEIVLENIIKENRDTSSPAHKLNVERAHKRVEKAAQKVKAVKEQGVVLYQSDIEKGALGIGVTPESSRALSSKAIAEQWVRKLEAIIGGNDLVDTCASGNFKRRDIVLMMMCAQAISDGDQAPLGILSEFYKQYGDNPELEIESTPLLSLDEDEDDMKWDDDDEFSEIDDFDLDIGV